MVRSFFLAVAFIFLLRTGAGSFGLSLTRTPVSRSGLAIGGGSGDAAVSGLVAGVVRFDAGVLPPLYSDSQALIVSSVGGLWVLF